jgi:hypothetical protein
MYEVIINTAAQILFGLIIASIGVFGAGALAKLSKREELANIAAATDEAVKAAKQTAAALQQQLVEGMKAANEDGKLTEQEIQQLGVMLLNTAMRKLSDPAKEILIAAGKDITAIIHDAAEAWIQKNHKSG